MNFYQICVLIIVLLSVKKSTSTSNIRIKSILNCNRDSLIKINILTNQKRNGLHLVSGNVTIPEDIDEHFQVNLNVFLKHITLHQISENWCRLLKTYLHSFIGNMVHQFLHIDLDLCKIPKGRYYFNDVVLNIADLFSKRILPAGDFRISTKLSSTKSNKTLLCYDITIEIV